MAESSLKERSQIVARNANFQLFRGWFGLGRWGLLTVLGVSLESRFFADRFTDE
jgi:hypothetical protein